jgi:hypothetical protein
MAKLKYMAVCDITGERWKTWVMEWLEDFRSYRVYEEQTNAYKEILPTITLRPERLIMPDFIFKRSSDKKWNIGEITVSKNTLGYWRGKFDKYMQTFSRKALGRGGEWTGQIWCFSLLPIADRDQDAFWQELSREYRKLELTHVPPSEILQFKKIGLIKA